MTHVPDFVHADYLRAINPEKLKTIVRESAIGIRNSGREFDAIAFRGLSGSLVAPLLALELGKTMIVVRKGEDTHSSFSVEGDRAIKRYIVVDDFVASGATVRAIREGIRKFAPEADLVGVWSYNDNGWDYSLPEFRE